MDFDVSEDIIKLNNILIIHCDKDEVVPVANAYEMYEKASEPKKKIILPNGDHQMSNRKYQELFIREAISWLK